MYIIYVVSKDILQFLTNTIGFGLVVSPKSNCTLNPYLETKEMVRNMIVSNKCDRAFKNGVNSLNKEKKNQTMK